jgi:hypothetical protein
LEGGINLFAYTRNNPTNFKDPSGLQYSDPDDVPPEFWRPYLEIRDFWYYSVEKLKEISKVTGELGLEIVEFMLSHTVWPSEERLKKLLEQLSPEPAEACPSKK